MLPTHELQRQEACWSIDGGRFVLGAPHEDVSEAVSAGSSLIGSSNQYRKTLEVISQTIAWTLTALQSSATDPSRA